MHERLDAGMMVKAMNRTISGIVLLSLLCMSLTACSASGLKQNPAQLTVFAAASLTECFGELAGAFEMRHGGKVKVTFNFAGSQALRTSVEAGTKADVLASADVKNPKALKEEGYITEYRVFAKNKLVLVCNKSGKHSVAKLENLAAEGIRIAVADWSVPAGAYWEKAWKRAQEEGVVSVEQKTAIEGNIRTRELNVKDVLSKVLLGEADVGVVYQTDALSAGADKIEKVDLPLFGGLLAEYAAAELKDAPQKELAGEFLRYLLSAEGKAVLKKYGFITD